MSMWDRLVRVTEPSGPVVTTGEIQTWLRDIPTDEIALATQLVEDATAYIEGPSGIGVALLEQVWQLRLDCFPPVIRIPLTPVVSVDEITYIDTDGAEQTLDSGRYKVDTSARRIVPAYSEQWPNVRDEINAVTVEFTAGHSSVPADLKRAIALLVGHWYQNREAVVIGATVAELPMAVEAILNKYRVGRFA